MRLDNIKNFRGYSYITKEEFGIKESNATLLQNLFVNSKINPQYIDNTQTSVATSGNILSGNGSSANPLTASISITANSGIIGNGDSTALSLDFSIIGEGLTNVGKSGTGTIAITGTRLTYNGAALNDANGLVKLDGNAQLATSQIPDISSTYLTVSTFNTTIADYYTKTQTDTAISNAVTALEDKYTTGGKIKTTVLPDLAITTVKTVQVSNSTSTIDQILTAAVTTDGVQSGDVVIVSGTTEAISRIVGGSYIFTAEIAKGATTVDGKYAKMYVPTGTVVSVNGETPDASGVVTVGWEDIGNGSVTSFTVNNGTISINNIEIASKSYVDDEISNALTTAQGYANAAESNAKNYADGKATDAETAAKGYADGLLVTAKSYADGKVATAESNAKTYTDTAISTLKTNNTNVDTIVEQTFVFATAGTAGKYTATLTNAGYVINVLNITGSDDNQIVEQCFPEVKYNTQGKAIITADFGSLTPTGTWKAVVTKKFTLA